MTFRRWPLAAALLLSAALPAAAFDPAAMSDTEKAAFGQAVRDYLMAHPETLIDAINVLDAKRAEAEQASDRALVETHRAALLEDGYSWVGGDPKGDVTVVEFIDYRCGVCRHVFAEVDALTAADSGVKVIFKEFPILGEQSVLSSRFAIAVQQVAGPDAYKKAHDALMTMRANATPESLKALAKEIGVDADAVMARMDSDEVSAVIRKNAELGGIMGINGTPSFVIGPELLRGVPQAGLKATIDEVRAAAKG